MFDGSQSLCLYNPITWPSAQRLANNWVNCLYPSVYAIKCFEIAICDLFLAICASCTWRVHSSSTIHSCTNLKSMMHGLIMSTQLWYLCALLTKCSWQFLENYFSFRQRKFRNFSINKNFSRSSQRLLVSSRWKPWSPYCQGNVDLPTMADSGCRAPLDKISQTWWPLWQRLSGMEVETLVLVSTVNTIILLTYYYLYVNPL